MPAYSTSLEIELKYDVAPTTGVPSLRGLPGVAKVPAPTTHELVATYYDTEDLSLRATKTTLRRRTGGPDAGWHLKTPSGADREELTVPLGPEGEGVPAELASLVRAATRGARLEPVAELRTRRTVHHLLAADGALLVEIADDHVVGTPTGGTPLVWREWEAELKTADRALLDAVANRLTDAGAVSADAASKVGRVLAGRTDRVAWWLRDGRPGTRSAGDVLRTHLSEQLAELVRRDPMVRRDLPDAVHKMRVATRRMRSAFQTMRPLMDRTRTDPLRAELAWLAGVLGHARDAEVQHARIVGLLNEEPDLAGPVRLRVDEHFSRLYAAAHRDVVEALDSARFLTLLRGLDSLLAEPPLTHLAFEPAEQRLPKVVRRSWRRLDRRLAQVDALAASQERDLLLHEARKDAKRARYVTEAVTPALGKPARTTAKAAEALTEALGDHQDGVLTREVLRQLADAAGAAGEPTWTYGRLSGIEQARGEGSASWPAARAAAATDQVRGWFS